MVTARTTATVTAVAALATAGWHFGPAATWLPALRRAVSPALDGQGDPRHVALTFDDGPDPRSTPHFLRELDRLSVRATFFVLGAELERYAGLGRRIVAEGHELAVHGWRHEWPWYPRPRRDLRDVSRAADAVLRIGGVRPLWYRPAYGVLTGGRWAAARRAGLQPVLWSVWGHDWTAEANPAGVLSEMTRSLRGGATVLLHDSDRTSAPDAWRAALGALPGLVTVCRERGLEVGPLGGHGLQARRMR
ncbi:polysaccharide deacetylase family protein [Streptomyces sp. 8N616]|uniref:polysaccharide deacetylase family protein n=1 Tax=Streptomyces sp. 8N616 TaxID=3457414 RepID=UPI003FD56976